VTAPDPVKKLASLLKKLKAQHEGLTAPAVIPEPPDEFDPLVHQLLFSMLLWEASTGQAKAAIKRVRDSVVDYNELRVCVPDEVAHVMGEKYPLGHERAMRLRSTLNDIYHRQHSISLAHLPEMGKREARHYLESLEGCPGFVASRLCLLGGIGHAVPVDERLCDLLIQEQVLEQGTLLDAAASWLDRHVRAEEALETYLLLQAWSDEHGHPPKRDKRPIQPPPPVLAAHSPPSETKGARQPNKTRGGTKTEVAPKKPKSKPRTGS
jgi:hypothetical protein